MDPEQWLPRVWSADWWGERIPAATAIVFAVLFAYGGSMGWWQLEGRATTEPWREVSLFPYGDRGDPNPGEAGLVIGWFVLVSCAVAWLWAPFGGNLGRVMTVIVFALACYLTAVDLPTFSTDGEPPGVDRDWAVLDALLRRDGWEWQVVDGMRRVDHLGGRVVGDLDIVALRERVQPGATLSLASAVGGLAVAGLSMVRIAFARRGDDPRRWDDPSGSNEFEAEASGVDKGFTYHRTGSVDQFGR